MTKKANAALQKANSKNLWSALKSGAANFMPLSPVVFLPRAAEIYPDRVAVIHGATRYTYAQFHERARRLASALAKKGVKAGDVVSAMLPNVPAMLEAHYGVPMLGAVLNTINTRLDADTVAYILEHGEAKVLIVDRVFAAVVGPALKKLKKKPFVVDVDDPLYTGPGERLGRIEYEAFLKSGKPDFAWSPPEDESAPIALNYTSGTTGRPKGVVYSHRSTVIHTLMANQPDHWGLKAGDSVLPATPMFHANCWGVPYACVMMGIKMIFPGPHLHPEDLLDLFAAERPTYALGVPTIWMTMLQLLDAQPARFKLPPDMRMLVGGAPVPEAMIRAYKRHGAQICHGWGMTEMSPLGTVSYIKPELQHLGEEERIDRYAMAGVPAPIMDIRLIADDGAECAWDGKSVGEVQVRGPFITGSYHGVPNEPEKFTADGWLRTGDVASMDAHGYLRITDRTKDLIKSGGEWISSVDMENLLMAHPAVLEAAVIAVPDAKWTERPLACVVWKPGKSATPDELRAHLAVRFIKWQLPDRFEVLGAIPRTSTGKFWKVKLREMFRNQAVGRRR